MVITERTIRKLEKEFTIKKRRLYEKLDVAKLKKGIDNLIALVKRAKVVKYACGDVLADLSKLRRILNIKGFESLAAVYIKTRDLCNRILKQPGNHREDKEELLHWLGRIDEELKDIEGNL